MPTTAIPLTDPILSPLEQLLDVLETVAMGNTDPDDLAELASAALARYHDE